MTELGARIAQQASSIREDAQVTQQIAVKGAEETNEPMSEAKFQQIETIQKGVVVKATDIEEQAEVVIDKNKGIVKFNFTFKFIAWSLFIMLVVGFAMSALTYFGVDGIFRKTVKAALAGPEKLIDAIADSQAKFAFKSDIDNSKFPKEIRERMKYREEND